MDRQSEWEEFLDNMFQIFLEQWSKTAQARSMEKQRERILAQTVRGEDEVEDCLFRLGLDLEQAMAAAYRKGMQDGKWLLKKINPAQT